MERKNAFITENFVDEFLKREREVFLNESLRNDKSEKLTPSPETAIDQKVGNQNSKDNAKMRSKEADSESDFVNEYLQKEMEEFLNEWHPFKDKKKKEMSDGKSMSSPKEYSCRCGFCDKMEL